MRFDPQKFEEEYENSGIGRRKSGLDADVLKLLELLQVGDDQVLLSVSSFDTRGASDIYRENFGTGNTISKEFLYGILLHLADNLHYSFVTEKMCKRVQGNRTKKERQFNNFLKLVKTINLKDFGRLGYEQDIGHIMECIQNPNAKDGEIDEKTAIKYRRALLFYKKKIFPDSFTEEDKIYFSLRRYNDVEEKDLLKELEQYRQGGELGSWSSIIKGDFLRGI